MGGIALTTVLGGAIVVAAYVPLSDASTPAQWMLVFALMFGESAAIHLPSEVILPVGGWQLVQSHHLGAPGVVALSLLAAAGNTVGSLALYMAGRKGGRPLVRRYGRYLLLSEEDVIAAERRMASHGAWATFASRLLPVVRTYGGFAAGVLRIPLPAFLVATFAGSFVWALAFVTVGATLGANWTAIRVPAEIGGAAMLVVLFVGLLLITARQLRTSKV